MIKIYSYKNQLWGTGNYHVPENQTHYMILNRFFETKFFQNVGFLQNMPTKEMSNIIIFPVRRATFDIQLLKLI